MAASADDLRARAMRLLARREYSRQELASKLLSKPLAQPSPAAARSARHKADADAFAPDPHANHPTAFDGVDEVYTPPTPGEINALLDDLEQRKMLSDNRYAEMRTRLRAPRYGDSRLRQELAQKGIDRDTINAVLAEQTDELTRCREIWRKKFGQLPRDINERMKQTRHLASRGFAMRVIQQVIRGQGKGDSEDGTENFLDQDDAS